MSATPISLIPSFVKPPSDPRTNYITTRESCPAYNRKPNPPMMFVAPGHETDKYRHRRHELQRHRTPKNEVHSADDFLVPIGAHDKNLGPIGTVFSRALCLGSPLH